MSSSDLALKIRGSFTLTFGKWKQRGGGAVRRVGGVEEMGGFKVVLVVPPPAPLKSPAIYCEEKTGI